jgi:hypothetical protein
VHHKSAASHIDRSHIDHLVLAVAHLSFEQLLSLSLGQRQSLCRVVMTRGLALAAGCNMTGLKLAHLVDCRVGSQVGCRIHPLHFDRRIATAGIDNSALTPRMSTVSFCLIWMWLARLMSCSRNSWAGHKAVAAVAACALEFFGKYLQLCLSRLLRPHPLPPDLVRGHPHTPGRPPCSVPPF